MTVKVRDLMTPGPIGVDYSQTIGEAARTMRDWGIGTVLVVSGQSLYGLVTDRDLVIRAVAESKGPDEAVGPLSSANLLGVPADADVAEALRLMRRHAVRRLPVIDDGQVAGVVSLGDLTLRDDPASALAEISQAELAVLGPDDDLEQAAMLVRERAVRRIPVVQHGAPVGVVSIGDLALDRDQRSTLSDVSAAPPNV